MKKQVNFILSDKNDLAMNFIILCCTVFFSGCSLLNTTGHDEQFVKVHFRYFNGDEINTFTGKVIKDLIPGKDSTSLWYTLEEQMMILSMADSINFFSFPDTIKHSKDHFVQPYFGPAKLRIKFGNKDKTVVICSPCSNEFIEYHNSFVKFFIFITTLTYEKNEYKNLPGVHGGYL